MIDLQPSGNKNAVRRTVDPATIRAAFSAGGASDPLEAHDERRRLLREGFGIRTRPRALIASTAAELGACIATLVMSAGRPDVLPGVGEAPNPHSIAAALRLLTALDDAGMMRWWSDIVDAADENMIGDASVEAMSGSTVIGMRSVVATLATRVEAAAEEMPAA